MQLTIEYTAVLMVNLGCRLDRFDSRYSSEGAGYVLSADIEPDYYLSPCLGVSHPITDRDMIRASYGHYVQVPNLSLLYWGSDVGYGSGSAELQGNPGLDAERTVAYELGVKHMFDERTLVDVTAFYKTITGLVSTEFDETSGYYWQFVNSEGTGTSQGVEMTLTRVFDDYWGVDLNYTYSIAKGRTSSTLEEYQYGSGGALLDDVYLDWDQRHMANVGLRAGIPRGEGPTLGGYRFLEGTSAYVTWSYGSGIPYDNASHGTHPAFRNQKRYPFRMNTDLRISREFWLGGRRGPSITIHCDIFNLFNRRNIDRIYNVAWYDADMDGDGEPDHDPTGPLANPAAWSPARHIMFGAGIEW